MFIAHISYENGHCLFAQLTVTVKKCWEGFPWLFIEHQSDYIGDKNMFKKYAHLFYVTILLCLLTFSLAQTLAGKDDVIKIAAVAPITGDQAAAGQDLINGIKLAVEEKNAAGGILGKQIELGIFDDKGDPKEAVSVANKIVSDPEIIGVVGHMNSGTTLPATPIYHRQGLPVVMPVPTNPKITQQGFNNLFRVPPTDSDQGPAGAQFAIKTLGKKQIAVLHDKTAYGQGIAEEFQKEAKKLKANILIYEGITQGDKDFTAILTRIKALKPEVIFFGGLETEGGLIVKQAKDLGITAVFISGDGCYGSKFLEISGKASEGTIVSFIAPPWKTTKSAEAFVKKFVAKYGDIKSFAPLGYDAANILIEGIRIAGKADKKAIIAVISSSKFSYNGVVGRTSFDKKGDNTNKKLYFYKVVKGDWVAL